MRSCLATVFHAILGIEKSSTNSPSTIALGRLSRARSAAHVRGRSRSPATDRLEARTRSTKRGAALAFLPEDLGQVLLDRGLHLGGEAL
jgi:hypothetical protein